MTDEQITESLETEVEQILEESRMVLPGIQTLFGFQLIAVLNQRFDAFGTAGKRLHLGAVILTTLAIGLIMAPAAYHRQAERDRVSRYFANYASRLITIAMAPLALGLAIEVGLVAHVITGDLLTSTFLGVALMLFLAWFWYGFPAHRKRIRLKRPRSRRAGATSSTS